MAPLAIPRWGYISFEWVPATGIRAFHNIVSHPGGGKAHGERARAEEGPNITKGIVK